MKRARVWMVRLAGLFGSNRRETEMNAELESHLALQIEDNLRTGMSAEEAQRKALLKLGSIESARESYREQAGPAWLENLWRDWCFGLRQLRKNSGFAATAIAMLAIGICASIAIFAFVDAALLKPLPYRDPAHLVGVFETTGGTPGPRNLSYLDYLDWKRLNTVFSSFEVYQGAGMILNTREGAKALRGARVSAGFFSALGVKPVLGRAFLPGEDLPNSTRAVLLSYASWQKRYGGSRDVLGKKIVESGSPAVIVGVLPREFYFAPVEPAEFWTTLRSAGNCEQNRSCHNLLGLGRLKPGISASAALSDVKAIAARLEKQYPGSNRDQGATVIPLSDYIVGTIRPILLALLAGAGLLLLIAGINCTSLLLVRSESRKREIAVRNALGAGKMRLILQFAIEGFALVLAGAALGILMAWGAIQLLTRLIPADALARLPYWQELGLDLHTWAFAGILTLLAALLFTCVPIFRLSSETEAGLREGSRGMASTVWRKMGSRLVVVELATATVLLIGAGLLGKSMYRLLQVDPGFVAEHLDTLKIGAPAKQYAKNAQILALVREIEDRIRSLPGVESVGITSDLPVEGWGDTTWFRVLGRPWHGEHNDTPERDVSAGYFHALQAKLIRGRFFQEDEDGSKPLVAIVNEAFAKHYFPNVDPIGQHISGLSNPPVPIEIVGVIKDIKEGPFDTKNRPVLYYPFNQNLSPYFDLVVRTSQTDRALLPTLVATIHALNPEFATTEVVSMQDKISQSQDIWLHRSSAWLVAAFALLALILATTGLYGVVAYSVSRRTREIGIRMAFGAERRNVYRAVLGEAGRLVIFGLTFGIAASFVMSKLMDELLFGVRSSDLSTIAAVGVLLATAAITASFVPARRAASVNPLEALRAE